MTALITTEPLFVAERNKCKRVLEETKSLFAKRMRHRIASNHFGSCDYWYHCYSVLNQTSKYDRESKEDVYSLPGGTVLNSSTTSTDGVDRSFQAPSIVDNSTGDTLFASSSSSKSTITNVSNENTPAAFGKEKIHATIEKKDLQAAYEDNSNSKKIYSVNIINESQTEGVKGSNITLLETTSQQPGFDNASLAVTVSNNLLNANTTDTVSSQEVSNSTQTIIPDVDAILKNRRRAELEMRSVFSDPDATGDDVSSSPNELNDSRHEMTSVNDGFVKKSTIETGNLLGEDSHQNKAVRTGRNHEKSKVLSPDFRHWFKKSNFRTSPRNKKSQRTILEEAKNYVRKRKTDLSALEMLKYKIRNRQYAKEYPEVSNLLAKKDTFVKRTLFPALDQKFAYSRGVPRLKDSDDLNKDNIHRSIVKKNSDYDYPNFDMSNIFFNIDHDGLQPYRADIEPVTVANTQCDFIKDSIEDPQINIPAQLDMIHIQHHVLSKTNCPLNEDNIERTLDNSEKTKIYKIVKFDSLPPINKLDSMSEYGREGSSHRNEEENDVFKQVELEVLGLDDNSQYDNGLLKNYSQSQIDDIFKKLYFDIFDIKEHRNQDNGYKESETELNKDRFFNKLDFDDSDDADEGENMIAEQVDSGDTRIDSGDTKDCNDRENIVCLEDQEEELTKQAGKASGKNPDQHNFNSVDFIGADENWVRNDIEIKPEVSNHNVKAETDFSFYITQECFDEVTLNKGLKAEDIQKAQKNCTGLENNADQNNSGAIAEDEDGRPEYISTTNVPTFTTSPEYQTTVGEDESQQEVDEETDFSDVDSDEMTHTNVTEPADVSCENCEKDLDLDSEPITKYNFSTTTSEYTSSPAMEDVDLKNVSETNSDDLSEDKTVDKDSDEADKKDQVSVKHVLVAKIGQSYQNNEKSDIQNKFNPTPGQKNVLRIFVHSKCQISLGKRDSDRVPCLENNSKENVPAAMKGAQQNVDNKDEIIMFSEIGADNVSQIMNPEAVVLINDGATL